MHVDAVAALAGNALGTEWMANLQDVTIRADSEILHSLAAHQSIIQGARNLSGLAIERLGLYAADTVCNDMDTIDGALAKMLRSSDAAHMLSLKALRFRYVGLHYAQRTVTKIIDFTALHRLELEDCYGAETLLSVLTNTFQREGCSLRHFKLVTSSSMT